MTAEPTPRRRLSLARRRPSGRRRPQGGTARPYVLLELTQHWSLVGGQWCRDAWVQTPAGAVELRPIRQGAVA